MCGETAFQENVWKKIISKKTFTVLLVYHHFVLLVCESQWKLSNDIVGFERFEASQAG